MIGFNLLPCRPVLNRRFPRHCPVFKAIPTLPI